MSHSHGMTHFIEVALQKVMECKCGRVALHFPEINSAMLTTQRIHPDTFWPSFGNQLEMIYFQCIA